MRYLLVDRITECRPGEVMKGIKNVAMTEDFLEFHFPKNPIMPGVMLLEALAQLTGWYEAASSDFRNWFLITKVHTCKFYGFAFPGDQIEIEIRPAAGPGTGGRRYAGLGMVKGKKKVVVEYEGDIVSLDQIEDVEDQKRHFAVLTRE